MQEIIMDFILQIKEKKGLPVMVTDEEIAKVYCAFLAIKDRYLEKQHVILIKSCCESLIEAEMEDIPMPITFIANTCDSIHHKGVK